MNGLAVERAANAVKADSAKNSAPIQPEDRQPNELLRRRKGAGPPTVVPMLNRMRGEMRGGKKDWGGNNQGHWDSSRYLKLQDNQPSSTRPSSQSTNGGVFHPSSSYPWHNPWPGNSSSSGIANRDVSSPHTPIRRGRPLPLPPRQDNNRSDTVKAITPVDVVDKPYSNSLPALKPRPSFSGAAAMRNPKRGITVTRKSFRPGAPREPHDPLRPSSSLERDIERSSSPKRRKIDNTRPVLRSNTVGEGISSNYIVLATPPPESQISCEGSSTGTTISEQPLATPSPSTTRMLVSPPIIKCEPESPPPLTEERKIVTTHVTRFPLPENCRKPNPQWQINRIAFRQEKAGELFDKGLQLIGRCIMRDDGMCIEWKSSVPVWNDTLEPVSVADNGNPRGGSPFSTPTKPTSPARSHTDDAMGPPSTRRKTNVVERPSPVLPSPSPSQVSQQKAHVLRLDVQSVETISPSPARSDASRKSHKSHIPRGNLDLATAIEMSQRINATPSRPRSFRSSPATLDSPSALATHYLSYPTILPSYPAVTSPSVELPRSKHLDATKPREKEAEQTGKGKDDDDDVEIIEVPEQSRLMEAVKAGWTVIENVCQSSEKGSSEQAEDDFDELMEDSEPREPRVDKEPEQVAPVGLSTEDADDTLTRDFINGYMQLFETDRDSLVSLYAPDAILRYRLLDTAQLPSTSSPKGLSSFPFMTARGRKEISTSLLTLDHVHFYQKVDEDGKNKIDLEYHREQMHDTINLYVRSTMTVDEDNEVPPINEHQSDSMERQQKRLVDHDFWLCKDGSMRSIRAVTEGHGPFLIRSHLIIMHEVPL